MHPHVEGGIKHKFERQFSSGWHRKDVLGCFFEAALNADDAINSG